MLVQVVNVIAFLYIAHAQPYEDPFLNKMEMFNEAANIICIDLLFCFTELIQEHDQKDRTGLLFISVVLVMITVHLIFLIIDQIRNAKMVYRKKKMIYTLKLAKQKQSIKDKFSRGLLSRFKVDKKETELTKEQTKPQDECKKENIGEDP